MKRVEAVLRAILRAGAYELLYRKDVPARVVITEYVDVAHGFYGDDEPGLVNAVLDTLAREVRGDELAKGARPERKRGGGPVAALRCARAPPVASTAPPMRDTLARMTPRPSEDDLIARYFAPIAGEGGLRLVDDAALLTPTPGHDLVLTADAIVAGVHFFPDDPPGSIARKALGGQHLRPRRQGRAPRSASS